MLQTGDGETQAIRAGQHYRLEEGGVAAGYPRPLAQRWPDLPSNIGAAVTWHKTNGNTTYFFSRDQFWKYDKVSDEKNFWTYVIILRQDGRLDRNSPKPISAWPNLPAGIEAALQYPVNNFLYFFKGTQYWKYDTSDGRKTVAERTTGNN